MTRKTLHPSVEQPKMPDVFRQYDPLREQELIDAYDAKHELLQGIRDIYALHGEDTQISDICNRLIDKYGSRL